MSYVIKDKSLLQKILWLDAFLGGSNAAAGLLFTAFIVNILGLSYTFIVTVSIITLAYAVVAGVLASQKTISVPLLRTLIVGNWVWTGISVVFLFMHFNTATTLGVIFLVLQVLVVGALAYAEGRQLVMASNETRKG